MNPSGWSTLSWSQVAEQCALLQVPPPRPYTNQKFDDLLTQHRQTLYNHMTPPVWYILSAAQVKTPKDLQYDYSFVAGASADTLKAFADCFSVDVSDPLLWFHIVSILAYGNLLKPEMGMVVRSESFSVVGRLSPQELVARASLHGITPTSDQNVAHLTYEVAQMTYINPSTLPFEILFEVLKYLSLRDVARLAVTCKSLVGILYEEYFWKQRWDRMVMEKPSLAVPGITSFRHRVIINTVRFSKFRMWLSQNMDKMDDVVIITIWNPSETVVGVTPVKPIKNTRGVTSYQYGLPVNMIGGEPLITPVHCAQRGASQRTGYLAIVNTPTDNPANPINKRINDPRLVGNLPLKMEHQVISVHDFMHFNYRRPLPKVYNSIYYEEWNPRHQCWPDGSGYYML